MKIPLIAALVLVLGCERAPEGDVTPDSLDAPLGPGTDSSILTSPDTPMTTTGPSTRANAGGPVPPDTIR